MKSWGWIQFVLLFIQLVTISRVCSQSAALLAFNNWLNPNGNTKNSVLTGQNGRVDVNNDVTLSVLTQLNKQNPKENHFFSPLILTNNLVMLANGASGATQKEILGLLERGNLMDLDNTNQSTFCFAQFAPEI